MEPEIMPSTDACRREQHSFFRGAAVTSGGEASDAEVELCLTCTFEQGRRGGLEMWRMRCPCCYSMRGPKLDSR